MCMLSLPCLVYVMMEDSVRLCNLRSLITLPPLRPFPLILNRGPISSMTRVRGVVTSVTIGTIHASETNDMLEITTLG